jgi:hypothetical protein
VTEITVFALGGVSQIEDGTTNAKTEFLDWIAGPVASAFIASGCQGMAQGHDCQRAPASLRAFCPIAAGAAAQGPERPSPETGAMERNGSDAARESA